MEDIARKLDTIRTRVQAAAARRDDERPVTLVAVSKKQPNEAIVQAHAAGCLDFGENYVQELANKAAALPSSVRWHFIGHLQRNKVAALLATRPTLIHGVDSERLLRAIDTRAEHGCDVLLQVDVSGEASKSGCAPNAVQALVDLAGSLPKVRVRGLMTMPPAGEPESSRRYFRKLRELADAVGRDVLPELSMGMSHDFEVAIEEGATLVRVGSAIFGARQ